MAWVVKVIVACQCHLRWLTTAQPRTRGGLEKPLAASVTPAPTRRIRLVQSHRSPAAFGPVSDWIIDLHSITLEPRIESILAFGVGEAGRLLLLLLIMRVCALSSMVMDIS